MKIMNIIVVAIFGPIVTKGAKYTYFIKYEIIVTIFKLIINICLT